jgi:NADH:ubiquinone oxidoreductase subunit C
MVYNLLSVGYNTRVMLITKVIEKAPIIPTIVPIYSGAV